MRTPRNQRPAPAAVNENIVALHQFVMQHGHQWKTKLRRKWLTDVPAEQAWMRKLRNDVPITTFGAITTADIERWFREDKYRVEASSRHECDDVAVGGVDQAAAVVSESADGAWVQGWLWVPASAIGLEEGGDDNE